MALTMMMIFFRFVYFFLISQPKIIFLGYMVHPCNLINEYLISIFSIINGPHVHWWPVKLSNKLFNYYHK